MKQSIRSFLIVSLLFTFFIFPKNAFAIIQRVGFNEYFVGFTSDYVNYWAHPAEFGRQLEPNWCWAASIQVSLNLLQIPVNQTQIVQEVFGSIQNVPGHTYQILGVLDQWRKNIDGKPLLLDSYVESSWIQVLFDLQNNIPIILALRPPASSIGHAVVVTGAVYKVNYGQPPFIEYLLIRDPWPSNPSLQRLPFPTVNSLIQKAIGIRIVSAPYGF